MGQPLLQIQSPESSHKSFPLFTSQTRGRCADFSHFISLQLAAAAKTASALGDFQPSPLGLESARELHFSLQPALTSLLALYSSLPESAPDCMHRSVETRKSVIRDPKVRARNDLLPLQTRNSVTGFERATIFTLHEQTSLHFSVCRVHHCFGVCSFLRNTAV